MQSPFGNQEFSLFYYEDFFNLKPREERVVVWYPVRISVLNTDLDVNAPVYVPSVQWYPTVHYKNKIN
jgi:hypothetical protein